MLFRSHLLAPQSLEANAAILAARHSPHVRFKFPDPAYYTDGSVIRDQDLGQLAGAAVFDEDTDLQYTINPNGKGPTNTINRAELAAIHCTLCVLCPQDQDALIFTDSKIGIQLIQKMIRRPQYCAGHIHHALLWLIASCILDRASL